MPFDPLEATSLSDSKGSQIQTNRVKAMEREIKLLKDKIQDLSQENLALREINVQFQLENFKLQQKIKRLENSQFDESLNESRTGKDTSIITFNDSTFDPSAEYLEEDILASVSSSKKTRSNNAKASPIIQRTSRAAAAKRSYDETFEDEDNHMNGNSEKVDIKQELIVSDLKTDDDYIPEPQVESDVDIDDNQEIDPKDAATTVYKLAAKRGILDKIKSLEPGKQKDSYFVNKILDLLFDRKTLASSSARGQRCQAKQHLPPRPALNRKKMNLCRQAFVYRLKREGLTFQAREDRYKLFNTYVNFKIQNSRKLMAKK